MTKRLYVGNLAYSLTEAELRDLFAEVGQVAEVKLVLDRETGRPRGFGFVEMSSEPEAWQAMQSLNGREVQGRPLTIREAQQRPGGFRPGARPGGGERGGGGRDGEAWGRDGGDGNRGDRDRSRNHRRQGRGHGGGGRESW